MKKQWENVDLIGILATSDEIEKSYGKENIFINNERYIQFYVKIISTTPYDYPDQNSNTRYISCFSSQLKNDYEDDFNLSDDERIEKFEEFIKKYFIRLNVEEKPDHTILNRTYYNGRVIKLHLMEGLENIQILHPVPLYDQKNSAMNFGDFVEALKDNKKVGNIKKISKENEDSPQFLFYKDEDFNIYVIGDIEGFDYIELGGFSYKFSGNIKYFKLDNEDFDQLITTGDNISYISTQLSSTIEKEMNSSKVNKVGVNTNNKIDVAKQEESFINHLLKTIRSEKLLYDEVDILNFHTAMKTSNLVILSGMSGTGKSKLVKIYAEALALKDSFKFIPVSPSWTEDSDIIGYADTLNMVYRPDDHGLIETLINAKDNPSKLYIICFDEMNLARIEHYFSQFLSLLEADVDNRKLRIYNKELGGKLYNSSKYKYEISIGKNVRFVGTANIDDSTYHFSDKVLDRSNLISLKVMPFNELARVSKLEKTNTFNDIDFEKEYVENYLNNDKDIELNENELNFFQELHDLLSDVKSQMGIGPRVIKQIDLYLKNIPKNNEVLIKKNGIDLQLVQRVISKIRGSREELAELLGNYDINSKKVVSSKILELLNKYKNISDFQNSKKIIHDKSKELFLNGYTF